MFHTLQVDYFCLCSKLPQLLWPTDLDHLNQPKKCQPNGIFNKASPNPDFRLTRTGRPVDKASRPVNPKPSVLEGITTRSAWQNTFIKSSRLSKNARTLSWLGGISKSRKRARISSSFHFAASTNNRIQ